MPSQASENRIPGTPLQGSIQMQELGAGGVAALPVAYL